MAYIFVHGHLRKGGKSEAFLADAEHLGTAQTEEAFALFIMDQKVVLTRRPVSKITGDIYFVEDDKLEMVDKFEGHPRINKRETVQLRLSDGTVADAWVYFFMQPLHNSILIESGDYFKQHA